MSTQPDRQFPESTKEAEERLIAAARDRDMPLVRTLVRGGTDPNVVDGDKGWTPLLWAVTNREAEIARLLLEAGADPNFRSTQGQTPLAEALHGHPSDAVVAVLLGRGADPNAPGRSGQSPVDTAVTMGYGSILNMMAKAGGQLEFERAPGKYLFSALEMLNAETLKGLIALGADVGGLQAPLIYAISHSRGREAELIEILEVLLDTGVDVNEYTGYHTTPLMWAVAFRLLRTTKYLLERGADPTLEDDLGRTALWWAVQFGYGDVERTLEQALGIEYKHLRRRIDPFANALDRLSDKGLVLMMPVSQGRTEIYPCHFAADPEQVNTWAEAHAKRYPKDATTFLVVQCKYDSADASTSTPDPFARSAANILVTVGEFVLITQSPRRIFNTRNWQEVRNDMSSFAIAARYPASEWLRAREAAHGSTGRTFVVKLIEVFTLAGGRRTKYRSVQPLGRGITPDGAIRDER